MRYRTRCAVGTWSRAVRLIEAAGMAVVLNQQVQTVLGWIDGLPDALVRDRPVLHTIARWAWSSPIVRTPPRPACEPPNGA